MAAIRPPKAPKAPKKPKIPDAGKAQEKAKKKAKAKAKAQAKAARKRIIKRLLFILIPLILIAIIGLLIWLFVLKGPEPEVVVEQAIQAAFMEDEEAFRALFTDDSIDALESAWSGADFGAGATRGSWRKMMRGILTEDELKPKIVNASVSEDGKSAEVLLDIDGVERTIHLVMVDEVWKIDVNLGIDPTQIVLPEEMAQDEELMEELQASDPENEMWWEDREAEAKAAEEKGGCLGCVVVSSSTSSGPPVEWIMIGVAGILLRRRRSRHD